MIVRYNGTDYDRLDAGPSNRVWIGTTEAFEAAKDSIPNNTVVYITDDTGGKEDVTYLYDWFKEGVNLVTKGEVSEDVRNFDKLMIYWGYSSGTRFYYFQPLIIYHDDLVEIMNLFPTQSQFAFNESASCSFGFSPTDGKTIVGYAGSYGGPLKVLGIGRRSS